MPAVVQQGDGRMMSFWEYLGTVAATGGADRGNHGSMLRELHEALGGPIGPSRPVLAPLGDVPVFLAPPRTPRARADVAAVGERRSRD